MWRELPLIEIRQLQTLRESQGKRFQPQLSRLSTFGRVLPSAPPSSEGLGDRVQGQNEGLAQPLVYTPLSVSISPAPFKKKKPMDIYPSQALGLYVSKETEIINPTVFFPWPKSLMLPPLHLCRTLT